MSAVLERRPRFAPVTLSGDRSVSVSTATSAHELVIPLELSEELSDSIEYILSDSEIDTVTVISLSHTRSAASVLSRLRTYAGAGLLGSVVCGLAFGWTEYRELAQWAGAVFAMLAYAVAFRRDDKL